MLNYHLNNVPFDLNVKKYHIAWRIIPDSVIISSNAPIFLKAQSLLKDFSHTIELGLFFFINP